MKEDGTIEALKEKWLGADESIKILTKQDWPGENGVLHSSPLQAAPAVRPAPPHPHGLPLRLQQYPVQNCSRKNHPRLQSLPAREKWLGADESIKILTKQDWPGENGTIRYYHDSTHEPMTYLGSGGEPLGLEIDLMLLAAREPPASRTKSTMAES